MHLPKHLVSPRFPEKHKMLAERIRGRGIVNMYGVFQTYYSHDIAETSSASAISWIGSIQGFLLCFIGVIIGPLYDLGHSRSLLVVGTCLSLLGIFTTSVCKSYWELLLAQGVTLGLGMGCLFLPGVTVVSQYFSTRKAFATGIASLGAGIGKCFLAILCYWPVLTLIAGGIVYPIVWTQLQPKIGFGWATRAIGFIMLPTLIFPLLVIRPLQHPKTPRVLFNFKSYKDAAFILFGCGVFFGYMGIYVVFFYIELYAMSRAHMSPDLAFYLLALINGGSIFGRIFPNFWADRIGTLNMMSISAFAAAVLGLSLLAIRNVPGIMVFCVLYGFFTGTFMSLPAPTTASLSKDHMESLGSRMSVAFITAALGSLLGSPIAGAILATDGKANWTGLQVWSGVCLVLSTVCVLSARMLKAGVRFDAKA